MHFYKEFISVGLVLNPSVPAGERHNESASS